MSGWALTVIPENFIERKLKMAKKKQKSVRYITVGENTVFRLTQGPKEVEVRSFGGPLWVDTQWESTYITKKTRDEVVALICMLEEFLDLTTVRGEE